MRAAILCFFIAILCFMLLIQVNSCSAQYASYISSYDVYVYDTHAEPPPDYIEGTDSLSFDIQWERGVEASPGFEIPPTWEQIYMQVIPNTPEMWSQDDKATAPMFVSLNEGYYAFTIVEVDKYNNRSGFATPFYLQSREIYARVPFNVTRPPQ